MVSSQIIHQHLHYTVTDLQHPATVQLLYIQRPVQSAAQFFSSESYREKTGLLKNTRKTWETQQHCPLRYTPPSPPREENIQLHSCLGSENPDR